MKKRIKKDKDDPVGGKPGEKLSLIHILRVLYACCTGAYLIKVVIGYILVKRGKWVVKIVDND